MRIITGAARGVPLATLPGEATRPTSERAKEAIFSMLQFRIEGGEVLDLFAGSGQLGLEALSRGASHAFFADSSAIAVDVIRKNAEKTRLADACTIIHADHAAALAKLRGEKRFDIVFLDPPYRSGLIGEALGLLADFRLLNPSAVVVCESGEGGIPSARDSATYEIFKRAKYGAARVTLLRPLWEQE